jgi:cell division septum initiation protein DivIVA
MTLSNDDYDNFDDFDDDYATPAPYGQPAAPTGSVERTSYDSETLLRRAVDIIATARTIPLSNNPMINRDEIIELLEEALHRIPEEMRTARWMLKERDEFVAKTRREADEILEAARGEAERMVQRTEVVRAAEQRARQVSEAAESDARRLRHETEDFIDQRLGSFEVLLDKVSKTVAAGRERLAIGTPKTRRRAAEPEMSDAASNAFFDQERL